jgi:hypothetical protein
VEPGPQITTFLAALVWGLGAFCVVWALDTWKCMTLFVPVDFPLFKALAHSEGVIYTLMFLALPLAALHLLLHLHQRHATDGERFPGQLGAVVIPPALRWMRTGLFVVVAVFPTFTYGYAVGRVFDQFTIEWIDELGPGRPVPRPSTKAGTKLLTDWGGRRPDGLKRSPFGAGWVWHAWQDDRPAFGTRTADGWPTARSIRTTAWPGLQPALFLTYATAGAVSLLVLIFRPMRRPAPLELPEG